MDTITEKTIVKIDLKSRWATTLHRFASEHPFLNVSIILRPSQEENDTDLVRVEFHTHQCSKKEANRRFFYFFLLYAEWFSYENSKQPK